MAEDEGRAHRIAELKQRNPRLTWAKIAEHVGVTERSAVKWQRTGALDPENAAKLADVFGVDFDYIWTGPRPDTPELFVDRRNSHARAVAVSRLEGELEERIGAIESTLATIIDMLEAAISERQSIAALLERQSRTLEAIEGATARAEDAAESLDAVVARAREALPPLRHETRGRAKAVPKTAGTAKRPASKPSQP